MLLPVPSHTSPAVLANKASAAPRSCAWRNATTLSAYDVVLRPAVAERSLRVHGTIATSAVGGHGFIGPVATITVGAPTPRSEPYGDGPPVTVTRKRTKSGRSASTASMPWRTSASSTSMPRPAAERCRRLRCLVNANGTPFSTDMVSKTPSPTTSPWSSARITAASSGTSAPLTHSVIGNPASSDRQQVAHFELRLLPFAGGFAAPGDPGTGPEGQSAPPPLVGADRYRQRAASSVRVDLPDGTAVDAAR